MVSFPNGYCPASVPVIREGCVVGYRPETPADFWQSQRIPQPLNCGGGQDQRYAGIAADDQLLRSAGFATDGQGTALGRAAPYLPAPIPIPAPAPRYTDAERAELHLLLLSDDGSLRPEWEAVLDAWDARRGQKETR